MASQRSKSVAGPKILVIGGGSVAWTPNVLRDLLLTPSIRNPTITLYDLDRDAADLCAAFLRQLAREIGSSARIESTDQQARAFDRADYAIITISTGGLDAMAHDLAIPRRFGIHQTVGDTAGPGGWARFFRNYAVFSGFAEAFNRHAPRCVVLNYTNPMCTLTDVLAKRCAGPVVGLCHGLFENIAFFQRFSGVKDDRELSLRYAGLNHFFWVTEARAGGRDLLAELRAQVKRRSLTRLAEDLPPDPMGYGSSREVATELFRATGVLPYLGDRHTCEFLPRLLNDLATLGRYKLERTTIAQRRARRRDAWRRVERMVRGRIDDAYKTRTRETAADIIDAHLNGRDFIDVGNMPNVGQIDNLPRGLVVETPVRVDRNGFQPLATGSLPDAVLGLIQPHALAYTMQVRAAQTGELNLALQALRADPLCAQLSDDQVRDLGGRLLKAHRRFLGGLFG